MYPSLICIKAITTQTKFILINVSLLIHLVQVYSFKTNLHCYCLHTNAPRIWAMHSHVGLMGLRGIISHLKSQDLLDSGVF
jgi:hypothetical protein